ncbi:MAG: site-specific DNA-methyltransferase [Rhodobacter sp.]|nr:site-specific DNA-methyltransferase [Rhodobacter sp.]MCA3520208.1 site-specific DNA-methyltransferase [Rhodobacter sp.]MCA3522493.1 site-specific DNA-methyltransferase [Rhodobacter sp.]MCA3527271.1 site-specific DNA-methyltransferase [Rhodobacter sp.]MCA3529651.1 site-specific DNA-methyltransferase [Rhodobacter sp.]
MAAPRQNQLYYGDNLDVLRRKIPDASVDLCYIDPPFNSKRNYFQIYNNVGAEDRAQAQAFVDTWEWGDEAAAGLSWITDIAQLQSGKLTEQTVDLIRGLEKVLKRGSLLAYLVHMTLRIVEIHRVLKPTGSFYLHCDPTASHYLKLVLDAVFCGQGGDYVNEIIWQRNTSHNSANRYGKIADSILFYTKSLKYTWNDVRTNYSAAQMSRYRADANGRLYRADDLTADRTNSTSGKFEWRGTMPPATRGWAYSLEQLEEWWAAGLILTRRDGTPRMDGFKKYLDEQLGQKLQSIWTDIPRVGNTAAERLGYPTQKPEALLERIIRASSNEGDTILDAYCGCGTTVAVAQRLNRRWIGIDITYQSISLILKRLQDRYRDAWPQVEANILLDGVPRDLASARALANRRDDKTRKEFEKWAVLTYSANQARINEKKGADAGIDGVAYFLIDKEKNGKAIFQVKSGGANRATLATLNSDRLREGADFGFLITFDPPSKAMKDEIAAAGKYRHPLLNREDDRIQVITVEDILNGAKLNLPMGRSDVVKSAKAEDDYGQTDMGI